MKLILPTTIAVLSAFAIQCKPINNAQLSARNVGPQGETQASATPMVMTAASKTGSHSCLVSKRTQALIEADIRNNPPIPQSDGDSLAQNSPNAEPQDNTSPQAEPCSREWEEWLLQSAAQKQIAPIETAGLAVPGLETGLSLLKIGTTVAGACGRGMDAAIGGVAIILIEDAQRRGWVCSR